MFYGIAIFILGITTIVLMTYFYIIGIKESFQSDTTISNNDSNFDKENNVDFEDNGLNSDENDGPIQFL